MTAHHAAYADADLGRAITASAERRRWLDELGTGEYPLPRAALDRLPQAALADIFHAQRKLLAELERLRQELRRSAPIQDDAEYREKERKRQQQRSASG